MKIAVIGAGASGMMAAITAATNGAEVLLFEKNDRVGKKILATGNGKCNLTNKDFDLNKYYCKEEQKLAAVFSVFGVEELLHFLQKNGLMTRERDGYVYPYCEQASVVLDFFRRKLRHARIRILLETEISKVCYHEKHKKFILSDGNNNYEADKVIVSCGGPASLNKGSGMTGFEIAQKMGHKLVPIVPGLVQLRAKDKFTKSIAGVRAKAELGLHIDGEEAGREYGEVQFTDYGISGIPVFQISRICAYALRNGSDVEVSVNLFPEFTGEQFQEFFKSRYETMGELNFEEFMTGTVHKKIHAMMLKKHGLTQTECPKQIKPQKLWDFLSDYQKLTFHITDVNGMENAQVCAGGVCLSEVTNDLESVKCPGLYFTGEVLDVDGKCGGYNLQWAFSSGFVAAKGTLGKSKIGEDTLC